MAGIGVAAAPLPTSQMPAAVLAELRTEKVAPPTKVHKDGEERPSDHFGLVATLRWRAG